MASFLDSTVNIPIIWSSEKQLHSFIWCRTYTVYIWPETSLVWYFFYTAYKKISQKVGEHANTHI